MASTLRRFLPDDVTWFRLRGWIPIPAYAATAWLAFRSGATGTEQIVGLLGIALGLGMRCAARLVMGRSSDTRRLHAHRLVTNGIYAWTRNPIYLANGLLAVGLAVFGGTRLVALGLAAFLAVHYHGVIRAEERLLEASFGASYAQYRMRVPRLLPVPPEAVRVSIRPLRRELRIIAGVLAATIFLWALG